VSHVVLLGPQRFTPTLGEAVAAAGVRGRLASVTAGWQEREAEDLELHSHLGERTVNLMLYARGEDLFERDPELFRAHRERQERLKELQEIYRLRLGHAQIVVRELAERRGDPGLIEPETEAARQVVRELDRRHVERVASIHAEFESRLRPAARPEVQRHGAAIDRHLERSEAVLIAGGHVAILMNRLRLFGFDGRIGDRPIFAWSAGAMALTERIVLFHHDPPQGYGDTELLEAGLGRIRGLVVLPHARRRLRLDDRARLERFARRFAPAECLTLDDGAWISERAGERRFGPGVARLESAGTLLPLAAA
jgi:hypothetical protein